MRKILFIIAATALLTTPASAQIEMTLVKGGTFNMGNEHEQVFEDELPVHKVTLSDFYIGTFEVSQKEWKEVMDYNPSDFMGDDRPVEKVTWYEAITFCNKLSEKKGLTPCYKFGRGNTVTLNTSANGYRLPTEAEWEYVAKGGAESRDMLYSGSNDINEVAWYKNNSKNTTHPSGIKGANELGIYDMSGNVWEWCWDRYGTYSDDAQTNPQGSKFGEERCRRGGGWHIIYKSCRNTNRLGTPPNMSFNYLGLRIARNAK